jgi:hypothetical protein
MRLEQLLEGRRAEERHVAGEQHERPGAPLQDGLGLLERMRRPKLRFLHGELQARVRRQPGPHDLCLVTDDERHGGGVERARRPEDVFDHRTAGHCVQHLRQTRLHPRALSGRQDHDMRFGH